MAALQAVSSSRFDSFFDDLSRDPVHGANTAAPSTGMGSARCDDGSTGTWTGFLTNFTVVASGSGFLTGNYLAAVTTRVCGGNPNLEP